MTFDLYCELASQARCPTDGPVPAGLASGFVDACTAWSKERTEARRRYQRRAAATALALPSWLQLKPSFHDLPHGDWIGIEVKFTLETPWYSKDDRPFHVLDNPLRKDRVFGVPYMSAASWKGLLRWACRMQGDDPRWILHLFGNEKGEREDFQRGALAFYPTWFSKIGFEVINPHSRKTRAGTRPIVYEVVPPGATGTLHLLYAPPPGDRARDGRSPGEGMERLLDAVEALLETYGISAKRTAGWGTARVNRWTAHRRGRPPITKSSLSDFKAELGSGATASEAPDG